MIYFLFIVIVSGFAFIGFQIMSYYKQRNVFYKDAILFCDILLTETNFNKMPLKEIIQKNIHLFGKNFTTCLTKFTESLNRGVAFDFENSVIIQTDNDMFLTFFNRLGKIDLTNQNEIISGFKKHLEIKINGDLKEEKRKGVMLFKVFICVGFVVGILCL